MKVPVVLAITSVLVAATVSASTASLPRPDPAMWGSLVGGGGDVELQVSLLPPESHMVREVEGSRIPAYILPAGAVERNGDSYVVRVSPREIPSRFIDPEGLVHFQVSAITDAGQRGFTWASARIVTVGDKATWIDPVKDAGQWAAGASEMDSATVRSLPNDATEPPQVSGAAIADLRPSATALTMATPGKQPAGAGASQSALAALAIGCPIRVPGPTRSRWGTVGYSYPRGKVLSRLTYSAASTSTFGVGVSYNRGGSYSASGTRSTSDDWGQDFAAKKSNRRYKVRVKYRRYICLNSAGTTEVARYWSPISQPGYNDDAPATPPSWNGKCGPTGTGTWRRTRTDGKDFGMSLGVQIADQIGINLSSRHGYRTSSFLSYHHSRKKVLCGNNGEISRASRVRFKKFRE